MGTNVYTYDAAGQMLSEGGLWPNDTVSFTYANRLRTRLGIASPTGSPWTQSCRCDDPPNPSCAAHACYHADANGNITALFNASQT